MFFDFELQAARPASWIISLRAGAGAGVLCMVRVLVGAFSGASRDHGSDGEPAKESGAR